MPQSGRFILIDHSIREFGGHYFEYAVHVLQAAHDAGMEPILGVHREFDRSDEIEKHDWKVFPVYRYDYWGIQSGDVKKERRSLWPRAAFRYMKWKWRFLTRFSRLGFMLEVSRQPGEFFRRYSIRLRSVAGWFFILFPLVYLYGLLKKSVHVVRTVFSGYLGEVLRSGVDLVRHIFLPVSIIHRHHREILGWGKKEMRRNGFATSTRKLFRKAQIRQGDIVFIPTLTEVDLLGLYDYFRKEPETTKVSWHLLFRRNIFAGREPDYTAQFDSIDRLRKAFVLFHELMRTHKVFFYTDTDKLTDQYNRMNILQFHTLPIPVNPELHNTVVQNRTDQPLTITYAGDARVEKGYQHLPLIIGGLWDSYVKKGKVRFLLQSNLPIGSPQGNAEAVIARSILEQYPPEAVTLINDALSTSEYRQLVMKGNICLLLYDSKDYYARSSGILVECLSAGIPVVVPAGTWLADQFIDETYRYRAAVIGKMKAIKTLEGKSIRWQSLAGGNAVPFTRGRLTFGSSASKSFCWQRIPKGSEYLYVSYTPEEHTAQGTYVSVWIEQLDPKKRSMCRHELVLSSPQRSQCCNGMIRLSDDAKTVWLGFSNSFSDSIVNIKDIHATFLRRRSGSLKGIATSAVGQIFNEPGEIPALLKEMVDHYEHYRETAVGFSKEYVKFHTVENLVHMIHDAQNTMSADVVKPI